MLFSWPTLIALRIIQGYRGDRFASTGANSHSRVTGSQVYGTHLADLRLGSHVSSLRQVLLMHPQAHATIDVEYIALSKRDCEFVCGEDTHL
jgi:hypothetical protein